jgi:hypothetical protein
VKPADAAVVAAFFFEDGDVAERPQRGTTRFVRRNAGSDGFVDEPINVERKLLRHLAIDRVLAQQRPRSMT